MMSQPRFQVLTIGGQRSPARTQPTRWLKSAPSRLGLIFAWRLLGANNRELGRSVEHYFSTHECVHAIVELKASSPDWLIPRIRFGSTEAGWTWSLRSDQHEVAMSSRGFHRRRECLRNLERFKEQYLEGTVQCD